MEEPSRSAVARLIVLVLVLASACTAPANDDGDSCSGDPTVWNELTTGPIACTSDSDCCVISNECLESEHVVACATASQASAAWPAVHCYDGMPACFACIGPPAIEARCIASACTGVLVDTDGGISGDAGSEDAGPAGAADAGVPVDAGTSSAAAQQNALHFGCGP